VVQRLRTVQGLLRLRREFGDRWLELACARCGVIDAISPKAMTSVIVQLQLESKAGLLTDSDVDDTSTPAYAGQSRFARDTRQMMSQ
jgi:hypothetical protein